MWEPGVEFGVVLFNHSPPYFWRHLELAISARLASKSHGPPVFTPSTRATGMYPASTWVLIIYTQGPHVCAVSTLHIESSST